ncbi:MAG: FliM/FliN family flagellar motor switch protein [Candidatus Gastranaerophilales bacterium]|nr:FliM/FliN family flagellar motor switch protein [Candidatus Gastranaerophilales bacterium]
MENQNLNLDENIMEEDAEFALENSVADDFKRGCKLYNFRRPDKFSKEHLKALQDIHRDFVRHLATILTAYLRMEVEIDVISVDQLTYEEYVCSMPSHVQNMIFKLNPLSGEISMGMSPEVLAVVLDRMLGGAGTINDHGKELTQIEELLTIKFVEKIIKILEEAWGTILPVKSEFVTLANGYHSVPITTSGEIVTLISFEVRLGQKNFGLMNICFPYPVLETVLPKLTPQYIYQHANVVANEIGKNETLERIKSAEIEMQVILGMAQIEVNDVLDLKIDDVIKLDQKLNEELVACINKKEKFYVAPGVLQNKICVKIVDQYRPKE